VAIFVTAADLSILRRLTRLQKSSDGSGSNSPARIAGIILAAGGSSRFGAPKQLLAHRGENLVRRAARSASEAGLSPVIVVLGAYASSIEIFLAGLEFVVLVVNEEWESGQASSLRAGAQKAAGLGCDAALIILADQPLVDRDSLTKLVGCFTLTERVIASRHSGVLGAPALFGAEYFDDLMSLGGDHGAGQWLRSHPELVTPVDIDEAAFDIDTPDDLKHLPT
jgi:CTP:molybdopterin cytidylyltransferase MocA